jgi:hypothetical protein
MSLSFFSRISKASAHDQFAPIPLYSVDVELHVRSGRCASFARLTSVD